MPDDSIRVGESFDLIVIGAGPAGSTAARRAAICGLKTLIIDKSVFPREKPCGGGLSAKAIEEFEFIRLCERQKRVIHIAKLISPNGLVHEVTCPEPLYIFSRNDFDGSILEMAGVNGAIHVPERVKRLDRMNGGWAVHTESAHYEIDVIVGADGAKSMVRRRVTRPFSSGQLTMTAGWYLEGAALSPC